MIQLLKVLRVKVEELSMTSQALLRRKTVSAKNRKVLAKCRDIRPEFSLSAFKKR